MSKTLRFKGLKWYRSGFEPKSIVVGGQGGISSHLTFLLSRVSGEKTKLICYDFDTIEEHNIGGQLFGTKEVGTKKVIAMSEFINNYGIAKTIPIDAKYDETSMASPVMFSGFDNMRARADMFKNWKTVDAEHKLFIDGRLNAENYEVFFVTKDNADRYEEYLFDDSEVEDAPCSAKQTSHYATSIASDMIKGYTNWIAILEGDVRDLPFRIHEVGELFLKRIEY